MSLRLEIRKKMVERSPRVKAIDFHNTNTWVVFGLYSGTIALHDYSNNSCIRTVEASNYPIRTVKFMCEKHWVVSGSDDFQIRVFNYNTMEKIKSWQAHPDFIRSIIVHPSEPYIISGSDDTKIKIWNYDKDFALVRTLEEHKHFVLALSFNPKDLTKFASASMDKTVKIWNLTTDGKANLTLTGHKSSVNSIDFCKTDKPHFVTGSDDKTIKIWDYQTKQCLSTIQSHGMAITNVFYHPELPIILSNSEDGKAMIHHSSSYALLNCLEYNLGMGWCSAVSTENLNVISFGYDEGSVVVKIGSDDPVVSFSNGKVLWTKSMEVFSGNLKAIDYESYESGAKVKLQPKELGSTEIYPTYLKHSPNSHSFGLCNRKEFIVIKSSSFKTVVSGNGTCLVWNNDSDFAVLDNDVVVIYNNFEKSQSIKVPFAPQKIFEGYLLGIADNEKTLLYNWNDLTKPIHKLELGSQKIWWNQSGNQLAVSTSTKFVMYELNQKNYSLTELLSFNQRVTSGTFVRDIFYYCTKAGKIGVAFLGKNFFYCNASKKQFILGALEQHQRLYLFDKTNSIYPYLVPFELLNQVAEFVSGKSKEPTIPSDFRDRVAKYYHAFDFKKEAYSLTQNQDHKFQLALQLGYIRQAYKIASSTESNQKTKVIGDLALTKGEIELAIDCYQKIDDLNSLLMIYSSLQLPQKLEELALRAQQLTKMNVAYMCYYLTNNTKKCLDVLIKSKRFSEAALFARTYCSDQITKCVTMWKDSLHDKSIAMKISDPTADQEEESEEEQGSGQEQVNH